MSQNGPRHPSRGHVVAWSAIVVGVAAALSAPVASGSRSANHSVLVPTIRLRAKLDAGQVPGGPDVNVPNATGLFTATLTGNKLAWTLTYQGLSGPALGAHIHIAKPGGQHWEPVIGLCGFLSDAGQPSNCRSGIHGTATVHAGTLYRISAGRVRKAILNGGAYVNIHTAKNYNWGEIRGQIEVVE
jgi:hypothetical protein